jgi:hypothetical protein
MTRGMRVPHERGAKRLGSCDGLSTAAEREQNRTVGRS